GGDPGIGKSTLLLQASRSLAERADPLLYVSGEESAAQVKLRADRLGIAPRGLYFLAETDLQVIEAHAAELKPRALVVDSIQTVFLPGLESAPGSVSQVRECAARLMLLSKGRGIATFLVGHVTKDGAIAGPRVLEHLVDTVLYFEGEQHHSHRLLRAVKNRFGSTNEIAVLEKRVGFPLQRQDVFVNVAGGGRVTEPAADLGVVVAAASSYLDRPVRGDTVVMGEVGLAGEVRAVAGLAVRLKEAAALGFAAAVVPQNNLAAGVAHPLEVHGVGTVDEAVKALLGH